MDCTSFITPDDFDYSKVIAITAFDGLSHKDIKHLTEVLSTQCDIATLTAEIASQYWL